MIIKFGTSALDVNARRLLRDGAPVHVTPKAFDVLVLLAQARPRAVKKPRFSSGSGPTPS